MLLPIRTFILVPRLYLAIISGQYRLVQRFGRSLYLYNITNRLVPYFSRSPIVSLLLSLSVLGNRVETLLLLRLLLVLIQPRLLPYLRPRPRPRPRPQPRSIVVRLLLATSTGVVVRLGAILLSLLYRLLIDAIAAISFSIQNISEPSLNSASIIIRQLIVSESARRILLDTPIRVQ